MFFTQLTLCGQGLNVKSALAKNLNPEVGDHSIGEFEGVSRRTSEKKAVANFFHYLAKTTTVLEYISD